MTDLSRRDVSRLLSAVVAFPGLGGCLASSSSIAAPGGPVTHRGPLIDAHCHIFNASDLPAVRFIKIAVLESYPRQEISTLDIDDPDALDGLVSLLAWIIGRSRAPNADDEIGVLDKRASERVSAADRSTNSSESTARVATFLANGPTAVMASGPSRGLGLVRSALVQAAGGGALGVDAAPMTSQDAAFVADKSFHSDSAIGRYMRWASLFTRYRYSLADELIAEHRNQGFRPLLLTPALVDYDKWLGEDVEESTLPRQVEVMARIARRPGNVPVHGYVAFDPLRAAYFRKGIDTRFDPIGLLRHALTDSGFLGTKIYPPMGFRPYGNEGVRQEYPEKVVQTLGRVVGRELDQSMAAFYDVCVELNAPVLAHAAASNGAGPDYKLRADPAHWLPVFARWPTLHVCLAHFGAFDVASAGATAAFPDGSWEWVFGQYVATHPESPVFADISYFSEVLDTGAWPKYARFMKQYFKRFDPNCQHMIFGTDWLMLGQEKGADAYSGTIRNFFETECGLDEPRLNRLFFENAIRFLGLRVGDPTRNRLVNFYTKWRLPESRLPK